MTWSLKTSTYKDSEGRGSFSMTKAGRSLRLKYTRLENVMANDPNHKRLHIRFRAAVFMKRIIGGVGSKIHVR
jgi:hypothetical protein